jgi:3-keto-disaccharide hydrolase
VVVVLIVSLVVVSSLFRDDMYDDFESLTYTLSDSNVSPNKKWINVYNGGGSSGVRNDFKNANNNVFFMYPKAAKFANETNANLVITTTNFSNFDMSVEVKTERQLRGNSSPNTWEVAWVLFRYTDDFHYYWFVQKPSGIELGKKDCDTCTDPFDGQEFLYTNEIPTLKLGQWANWKISAIGNNFTVSINGTELVNFTDFDISPQLESGAIGFYDEDASVVFDNIRIKEIV